MSKKFSAIQLGLASPERILEWSYGEVKKPETINYRSQKPERDGLFCERIFGPSKSNACYCGKYKKVNYKGLICDRCGVEITDRKVRRVRMGHIELAAPVSHIWYLKGTPSRISLLLNIQPKAVEEIIYFVAWIVTDPKNSDLKYKQILSAKDYRDKKQTGANFVAKTGAEAIKTLLEQVDCKEEKNKIEAELVTAVGDSRKKLIKRLETVNAFLNTDNKPEWMVLTQLPVIPPDLRPMLPLDGGRFATSDLNDLYRRVITRNNRLKKLLEMGTPAIIVQNEKRMLQEAVDALIDNGRRSAPIKGAGNRVLKSLSHSLKGKQGRFRQNLLGKRVDYSGRSVIAVGPDLKMYQCGIPREMAIQLYRPFVIRRLYEEGIASSQKIAEKLIDKNDPQIYDVLEDIMENHPVLLNRAPTLHRLGIQAFKPKLVEGRAIRLHPLTCAAFNADFDGDQMAVHLPLSEEAKAEAEVLMLGSNNILGPKDGKPIVTPSQDMVLGNFYLNMEEKAEEFYKKADELEAINDYQTAEMWRSFGDNEGHIYRDYNEVIIAYEHKLIHLHTRIAIKASSLNKTCFTETQNNSLLITTVGKLIFNSNFPADFPYIDRVSDVDKSNLTKTPEDLFVSLGSNVKEIIKAREISPEFKKNSLSNVISEVFRRYGTIGTSEILDAIKDLGYKYSTVAGMTVSLSDINVAPNKQIYVEEAKAKAGELQKLQDRGLLTAQEWEKHFSKLWDETKNTIGNEVMKSLPRKSPINMMAVSGARGNKQHFTQLAGMRGLMARPTQSKSNKEYQPSIIEVPIYSSFREGLNVSEFFISTHGVRKGLTDTALKTAESGYLTRRLVDVAQQVVISEDDCFNDQGYLAEEIVDNKQKQVIESLRNRIVGRYSKQTIIDPNTAEIIIESDEYIDDVIADRIVSAGIKEVLIRNVFTCKSRTGICRKCYGRNMATGKLVENGEAVGIVAAQSIGEPGTQLTMRTFHTGGVATDDGDITQGLPRVEELFEARTPKRPAVLSKITGEIIEISDLENGLGKRIVVANENDTIEHRATLAQITRSWLKVGSKVKAGDKLTEGNVAPKELIEIAGVRAVQNYILKEVKKVYALQGIDISDKHVEVIIKQMLKKVLVVDGGSTGLSSGQTLSVAKITEINDDALLSGKVPAKFVPTLLGISKSSVETDSFLSAASFQETTKVLTDAAINNKIDRLEGLKENVIIGKLIPAGTGSNFARETTAIVEELARLEREDRQARNNEIEQEKEKNIMPREIRDYEDDDDYVPSEPAKRGRKAKKKVEITLENEDKEE